MSFNFVAPLYTLITHAGRAVSLLTNLASIFLPDDIRVFVMAVFPDEIS